MLRLSAALLMPILGLAQTAAPRPRFEACDVQISKTPSQAMKSDFLPGGRLDARNVPLLKMIAAVYRVSENMVSGPPWLASERYNISAKAPPTSTEDQLFAMTRTMLAERFKMRYHTESRPVLAYALVATKKGPKLTPSPGGKAGCDPAPPAPGGDEPHGTSHRVCHGMTMAGLAQQLSQLAPQYLEGLSVVDQSGIKGTYDFKLDWVARGVYSAAVTANGGAPPNDERMVSMFDALEKVGLRLESRTIPLDVMVIDGIERTPTAN